jgi:hypothetical protein
MNTYLINYDLNTKGQDYKKLINKIETDFTCWWHHLDSLWIVKSDLTAKQILELLHPLIDDNDSLLVTKLSGEAAWQGINQNGAEWLSENLTVK